MGCLLGCHAAMPQTSVGRGMPCWDDADASSEPTSLTSGSSLLIFDEQNNMIIIMT